MMKITKSLSTMICAVLLVVASTVTFFAQDSYVLADDASIFIDDEAADLESQMDSVASKTGWQIIIHTSENGISSDNMETYYNATYYDGQDFADDSVMLVIDMASNNRIILTHGSAMYYFDDSRMTEIKSKMKPYLQDGDMYGASSMFLETTERFYTEGKPGNGSYSNVTINDDYEKQKNPFLYLLTHYGVVIGVIAVAVGGLSVVLVFRRYKNNGKKGTYDLKENSVVHLTDSKDEFLYKNVSSVRIDSSDSSSSSSSSGSSHGSSGSF